jgi:hypothetical protein
MSTSAIDQLLELKSFAIAVMTYGTSVAGTAAFERSTELTDVEIRAPKTHLKGYRMAVNDCIEMTGHWSAERVGNLDAALRNAGIITLSEVRRRYSFRYAAILKRGNIRNEVEYYQVSALVSDMSTQLPEEERMKLQAMIDSFEQNAA